MSVCLSRQPGDRKMFGDKCDKWYTCMAVTQSAGVVVKKVDISPTDICNDANAECNTDELDQASCDCKPGFTRVTELGKCRKS